MSDWWSKKLGQQTTPQYGLVVPPAQHHQPQPVHQQQPQAPQQQQHLTPQEQAILEAQAAAVRSTDDPNRKLSLREAVSRWQGGEAWRTEGGLTCPGCGSRTGYTQYSGTAAMSHAKMDSHGNLVRPRGHCFECGYNGIWSQGQESSWA
jgi:hypothetical protein